MENPVRNLWQKLKNDTYNIIHQSDILEYAPVYVYFIIHYCAFAGECKFKDLVSKRLITKGISLQRHIKKSANKDNISIPYSRYNIPSLNKIILINII